MIRLRGRKDEVSGKPSVPANGAASRVLSQTVNKRHFLKTLLMGAGLAAVAEMGQVALAPRTAEATLSDPEGINIGNRPNGPGINLSWDGTNDRAYTDVYHDAAVAYKPWRINASNLVINNASSGRVAIGKSNPEAILDVAGGDVAGIRYLKSGSKDARIQIGDPNKTWALAVGWATAGDFSIIEEYVAGDRLYIQQGGNVGISTASPAARLHIQATGRIGTIISGTQTATDGIVIEGLEASPALAPSASTITARSMTAYPNFQPPAGVTITNAIGLHIQSGTQGGAGIVTDGYGLYVDAPGFGSNRYAAVFIGGNVGIAQPNPQALLHLGNGAFKIANTLIADSGGSYYAQ